MLINSKNAITDHYEFLKKFGYSQNAANTTTQWHPSDTKELFDANLKSKERRRLLMNWDGLTLMSNTDSTTMDSEQMTILT